VQTHYYTKLQLPDVTDVLTVVFSAQGLRYVGVSEDVDAVRDDGAGMPYVDALRAVMAGEVDRFALPLDVAGTAFQQAVWAAVQEVGFGETASYVDIAERLGKPQAMRAGAAIGRNPVLIAIPCHRVIAKSGKLTGFRDGLALKAELLAYEQQYVKIEGQV
jgi:O-6-methylguanine DNA methyltransferase